MICPYCNKETPDGSNACAWCGKGLSGDSDISQPSSIIIDSDAVIKEKRSLDGDSQAIKDSHLFKSEISQTSEKHISMPMPNG